MKVLSIIIPVYNEEKTIKTLLNKIEAVHLLHDFQKEIIIIDDKSTDTTKEILKTLNPQKYKLVFNRHNLGKGGSIRKGLEKVTGDYVIIQDGDLEYNPEDYNILLKKCVHEKLPVVYGSRRLNQSNRQYSHLLFFLGANLLNFLTNLLYNQKLTDAATCYKMFHSNKIKNLNLQCKRFEFCPEVTALLSHQKIKIQEVPINYSPRSNYDGKKISIYDFFEAVDTLMKNKHPFLMRYWNVIKYLIIGGSMGVLDLLLLYVFTDILGLYYIKSAVISFFIVSVVAYFLHKIFTFQKRDLKIKTKLPLFLFISIIGLGINIILLYFFTDIIGIYYLVSSLLVKFFVLLWNYLGNKYLVYTQT